eukprot:6206431-Pleurochrysis_carterae.AAC.3
MAHNSAQTTHSIASHCCEGAGHVPLTDSTGRHYCPPHRHATCRDAQDAASAERLDGATTRDSFRALATSNKATMQ